MSRLYCYEGECGLSADQLWWLITIETLMEELEITDIAAAVAIVGGANIVPTRVKPQGAIPRTSIASVLARRLARKRRLPFRVPTLTGFFPPSLRMTSKIGSIAGRAMPVFGWAYTAYELGKIAMISVKKYNTVVHAADQVF